MNIFVLDEDYNKAAEMHNDKHLIKMIVESAQILSTAVNLTLGYQVAGIYKSTHKNHSCVKWAMETSGNYYWLCNLAKALCNEYKHRYNKTHKTTKVIEKLRFLSAYIKSGLQQEFIFCGPEHYKFMHKFTPVRAYREYYKNEKRSLGKWTNRETPNWFNEACFSCGGWPEEDKYIHVNYCPTNGIYVD